MNSGGVKPPSYTSLPQKLLSYPGGKLLKHRFYINDVQLENAQEYKYLGIFMRASGTFTNAIPYLSNQTLKVIFMIRRRFQTEAINATNKSFYYYEEAKTRTRGSWRSLDCQTTPLEI